MNNPIRKWAEDKRHFYQRIYSWQVKYLKRYSTLLTREMQIEAPMRYHYTPIRKDRIKKFIRTK